MLKYPLTLAQKLEAALISTFTLVHVQRTADENRMSVSHKFIKVQNKSSVFLVWYYLHHLFSPQFLYTGAKGTQFSLALSFLFFQLLLYIFHRACSPSFQGPSLQYASSRPHEVPLNKNLDIFILHLLLRTVILSLSFWHKYKAFKSKGNCYITSESYSANSSHIKFYIFFPWGESHVLHIKLVLY